MKMVFQQWLPIGPRLSIGAKLSRSKHDGACDLKFDSLSLRGDVGRKLVLQAVDLPQLVHFGFA